MTCVTDCIYMWWVGGRGGVGSWGRVTCVTDCIYMWWVDGRGWIGKWGAKGGVQTQTAVLLFCM